MGSHPKQRSLRRASGPREDAAGITPLKSSIQRRGTFAKQWLRDAKQWIQSSSRCPKSYVLLQKNELKKVSRELRTNKNIAHRCALRLPMRDFKQIYVIQIWSRLTRLPTLICHGGHLNDCAPETSCYYLLWFITTISFHHGSWLSTCELEAHRISLLLGVLLTDPPSTPWCVRVELQQLRS